VSGVRTDERADPWQPPTGPLVLEVADRRPARFGRTVWVAVSIIWTMAWLVLIPVFPAFARATDLRGLLPFFITGYLVFFLVVHLWLISRRLLQVGYSPWFAFLVILPGANLWIGFLCLIAPAGYAQHRRLDRAGRIVAGLCLLGVVLLILSTFW
jgi:hypothetical protein